MHLPLFLKQLIGTSTHTQNKEFKESMMTIIHQIENIRKKIEIINEKRMKNLELKSTKMEVNKFIKRAQQQT